jgi:hypothetical protein
MADYLSELIVAVRKSLQNNKTVTLDKERLKKVQRVGARYIRNLDEVASS